MTLERAIEILEQYRKYRCGDSGKRPFFDEITEAIDTILNWHKNIHKS